jgi:pimeloyl-ACP methyl ester carboxylesterase
MDRSMIHSRAWVCASFLVACTAFAADSGGKPPDRYVTMRDNARIRYVERGENAGRPPLLLIPGWTFSASIWTHQIDVFSRSRRVVAIDPRSQGESTKTADGNTPDGRARDLEELMPALALDQVVVVGWSQGVQDVAAYLLRFGTSRVAAVVLVDTAFSPGPAAIESSPQATQQLLRRMAIYAAYPRDYLAGMMDAIILHKPEPAQIARWVDESLRTPTSTGISMLVSDLLTTDLRPAAAKLDKPTLIIASASSPELSQMQALAAALPRGRIAVVGDAGHAVFLDQPAEFNRVLEEFLQTLGPGPKRG